LSKQKVTSDNGFLFIKQHIHDTYLETKDEDERKLDRDTLMKIYRGMSEKAQKNTPKMDWNLIRSHNIRKYFNSAMLNSGADSFFVEFCMGHTLDETRAAYFRASPEKLKEIYLKYVPYLTIQKEIDIEKHPDFIKIKEDRDTFARAAAVAQVENYQLRELKAEVGNKSNELELLKAEVEKLKKESIDRAEEEALFTDIIFGELSYLNRESDFDEKHDKHYKMMDDPEYCKRFQAFEKVLLFDLFKDPRFEKEYSEHDKKDKLEQLIINTIDNRINKMIKKPDNSDNV
jgi:hypothetical protein